MGEGAAQVRQNEVLPPMGIFREGIPAPEFTSPMRSPKKYVALIFGDLFQVNR